MFLSCSYCFMEVDSQIFIEENNCHLMWYGHHKPSM